MTSSNQFSRLITLSLTCATMVLLAACSKENSNDQALGAAVSCLDTAQTATQADSCSAMVSGQSTAQAYLVRCSANLIAQGLTGTRLSSAFQNMNSSSGSGTSTNQTAAMMSYFVFAQNLPNDTADITNTNCGLSNVASLAGLASLIDAATILATAASGGVLAGSAYDPSSPSFNPALLQTAAASLYASNNPTTNAQIGTLAQTAQSSYCSTGSALATQNVCTQLNNAISNGSGNAANIGHSLLNLLQQASTH